MHFSPKTLIRSTVIGLTLVVHRSALPRPRHSSSASGCSSAMADIKMARSSSMTAAA